MSLIDLGPPMERVCLCGFPPGAEVILRDARIRVARVVVSSLEEASTAEAEVARPLDGFQRAMNTRFGIERGPPPVIRVDDGADDVLDTTAELAAFLGRPSRRLVIQAINNDVAVLLINPLTLDRSELMALFRLAELRNVRLVAWNRFMHYSPIESPDKYVSIDSSFSCYMSLAENAALAATACFPRKTPVRAISAWASSLMIDYDDGCTLGVRPIRDELDTVGWCGAILRALANTSVCGMTEDVAVRARALAEAMERSAHQGVGWVPVPAFRTYVQGVTPPRVVELYREQRTQQSHARALRLTLKYCMGGRLRCTMWEALQRLRKVVDKSDPDVLTLANDAHALQTAAMLRRDGHPDHLVAIGLIHDLGKIMVEYGEDADGTSDDAQWAVVGDTFVTGHPIPDCVPFPEFNALNPDHGTPSVYEEGCGLENVVCSHGHDEWLYRALVRNRRFHRLPEECLYIARYHSLYAWHSGGAYTELESPRDREMKRWVRLFQSADLYSKSDDVEENWDDWKPFVEEMFGTEEWDF